MTAFALVFTLSAIGISETVYLIRKRIEMSRPVCPIGDDCTVVLESKYNKFFLIPNDLLGLLFYIAASVITAFLVIGVPPLPLWLNIFRIFVFLGSIMSLYFVYLQWRVIKAWCFWCVMSACTIWLMAFIMLVSGRL